jgi:hypothetical protein
MLRTKLKDKVSGDMTYPVGAQTISEALGEFPQQEHLQLYFWCHKPRKRDRAAESVHTVAHVSCGKRDASISTPNSWIDMGHCTPYWELGIQAVPRKYRARVKELLLAQGFSQLKAWLLAKRTPLELVEGAGLRLEYDSAKDCLLTKKWSVRCVA